MTKLKKQQIRNDEAHKELDSLRQRSPTGPIPIATSADVKRIVRRDFPAEQVAEVLAMLDGYGVKTSHREPHRVRLAALKLAAGKLAFLQSIIEVVKEHAYDIITHEEYPGCMKEYGICRYLSLSDKQWQRIIDADCKQYQDWLAR